MKTAKLKDITLTITDGKHGDCKNHNGSGYYFISCKDVYDETIHYENARQITEDDFRDADRRTNLAAYDILITNSGTIGRMALVKDIPETRKTTFQKSVAIVRADTSQVVPNYLYYLLKSKVHDFINSSNGSAQKNLLLSTMRDFDISFVDSLETQHRIAAFLSRYDSLIENYQKQIKLLEEAAQRLYKEWFVDLHFPGHENTKIVDGVPEGWEKKKVADVVVFYDKMRKPLSSMQRQSMEKIYPYYGAASLMDYVDNYLFDGTYLLMGEDGTVISNEKYPMLQYVWGKFWVSNHAHVLQGKEPYSTEFIYMMLKQMTILDVVTGAAQPKISQGRLAAKEIIMPANELVKEYDKIVVPMIQQAKSLQSQLRLLTEARDRLLPKLMSGAIEV